MTRQFFLLARTFVFGFLLVSAAVSAATISANSSVDNNAIAAEDSRLIAIRQ